MTIISNLYKQATVLLTIVTLGTACQSSSQNQANNNPDSSNHGPKKGKITKRTQDGCYMRTSGNQMRDTQYVQLHVENNKVSGKMIDKLFEKDIRTGTLVGTVQKDKSIRALWTFMQEGKADTLTLAFLLNHTGLAQKPLKTNTTNGRQLTDAAAKYSIELQPTDCNM
jgi:hypothetical protein